MKLVFRGNRKSLTIKSGWILKRLLGKHIKIMLWDGYLTLNSIYFKRG